MITMGVFSILIY